MKITKALVGAMALGVASFTSGTAMAAAEVPCSTAKLIVPWAPGGGTHIIFSIFEEIMNKMDGPKIQVVTISGQGGNKGAKEAKKAKADGMGEDDQKIWSDEIQDMTDKEIASIDKALEHKQEEIMQV